MTQLRKLLFACIVAGSVIIPFVLKTQAATHFVTHDGSAVSNCTVGDPCTLTRAVALLNNGTINDGHVVAVQCASYPTTNCYYSQAALSMDGSGSLGSPITWTFSPGAILTGTRLQYAPGSWTKTAGRTYVYEVAHSQSGVFNSSNPAQRNPTNWDPIMGANTAESSLRFELLFSPRYSNVTSIAEVDAQSCTHFDTTTIVYVHMCNDEAPSTESDLWLSSTGWGALTITGDYITLDGLQMQHSQKSGQNGFHVHADADNTIVRNFLFKATGMTIEGTNWVIEDGEISHVILQGEATGGTCFDSNPTFGVGECWNAGGNGSAIDVGRQDLDSSFGGVVRNIRAERGWNGITLRGPNTVEDSVFWGFHNHTSGINGNDGVFRRNIMANGQDSSYSEGSDFDNLTFEYNLAHNGVLFWVSRDAVGGTEPAQLTFRYNIIPTLTLEDKTEALLTSDCNIWMENLNDPGVDLVRVTASSSPAGSGITGNFNTLAAWQAATAYDDNSIEMTNVNWTNGSQYVLFTTQNQPFDFHPVTGAQSLNMPAACPDRIGPLDLTEASEPGTGFLRPLLRKRIR